MEEDTITKDAVTPKKLDQDTRNVVKRLIPLLIGDKTYKQARAGLWSLQHYKEVQMLTSILNVDEEKLDIDKEKPVEGDIKGNHYALELRDNKYQFRNVTDRLVIPGYNESQLETLVREPSLEMGLPVEAFPQMPAIWKEQYKAERDELYKEPQTLTEWHSGPNQILREIYGIKQTKPAPQLIPAPKLMDGNSEFTRRTTNGTGQLDLLDEWWQDDYGKYQILTFFHNLDLLSDAQKVELNQLETRLDTQVLKKLENVDKKTGNFIRAAKVLTEHKLSPKFYTERESMFDVAEDATDVDKLIHSWVNREFTEVLSAYETILEKENKYGIDPRLGQYHAVHKARNQKRFGVWDTMGAGKTLTAILIDDEYNEHGKTLILGPKSSRDTWTQYENDDREFMTFEEFSNTKVDGYDHVIIDEAHLPQVCNTKSETDSHEKTIAQKIRERTEHTERLTLLSGTPLRNKPKKDYEALRRLLRPKETGQLDSQEVTLELHTYGIRRDHTILATTIPQIEHEVHDVYAPQESLQYTIALKAKQSFHTKRETEMSKSPARIQAIKDNIANLDGKHVIISRLVKGVHDQFDALQINGSSDVKKVVDAFNKDADVVIISSAKAQSYDLSAADHVHVLGYGMDLSHLEQALARVIRPSKDQHEKTVRVHHYLRKFDESEETFGYRVKNWMQDKSDLINSVYLNYSEIKDLETIHHGLESILVATDDLVAQYRPEQDNYNPNGRKGQKKFHDAVCVDNQCAFCDNNHWDPEAAHVLPYAIFKKEKWVMKKRNGIPLCANHHKAYDNGKILLAHNGTSFVVTAYKGMQLADIKTINDRLQHLDPNFVNMKFNIMQKYLQGKPVNRGKERDLNWNRLDQSTIYTMETA